jgi:hypothetical protein
MFGAEYERFRFAGKMGKVGKLIKPLGASGMNCPVAEIAAVKRIRIAPESY